MSRPEREYRSEFRSLEGPFEEIRTKSLGESPYGEIVRITGRRGHDIEERYTIRGTSTVIRGFDYRNEYDMRCFEILEVASPSEGDPSNIGRGRAVFEAMERECSRRRVQVLTTLALAHLARALCAGYQFLSSSHDDQRRMDAYTRGTLSTGSVSLYKMLRRR